MTLRHMARGIGVLLVPTVVVVTCSLSITTACKKSPTAASRASAAESFSVLVPMDLPVPSASALPRVPRPDVTPGPAAWAAVWDDHLEQNYATPRPARCPSPVPPDRGGKPDRQVSVRFELVTRPRPTVELVIPSLGLRRRLWAVTAEPGNPNSCMAGLTADGQGLRFDCSEVMTSLSGKVFARGHDVVLGQVGYHDETPPPFTRFELPCDAVAHFEPIACPASCETWKTEEWRGCSCSELAEHMGRSPRPSTTSATAPSAQ